MAIFEKQYTNNITLDDTETLTCVIENAHNINKHTEYTIRVQRGPTKARSWCVSRRYNDFSSLHSALQHSEVPLPLPPKKLLGNMQPCFIAERQVALQVYLNEIMKNNMLASSLQVKMFLDPHNYSKNIIDQALQNVSLALRGDGDYELKTALPRIGWRIRKHYYLVSRCHNLGEPLMMSWSTYGPDKVLTERDMQVVFKSLMNIECPYIDSIVFMHSLEAGAYVIHDVHPSGTVRDVLYGTHYANPHLAKYALPKQRTPFSLGQVANIGYQILLALKFLHDAGFPYGHLHPGNIVLDKHHIRLLDIENSVLGVPCSYRHLMVNHKKINTMEAVDVYSFGHTLYEMAFAEPLLTSTCETYPDGAPPMLVSFLESILSPQSCKRGMPTIDCLLVQPFFTAIMPGISKDLSRYKLKFPSNIKQELEKTVMRIEARLKADQKLVRAERRQLRIQEILSSEEELRKRKKKMKTKESAVSDSRSLNGFSHMQNGLSPLSMSGPSERSGSVASTLSTSSTPTPPKMMETPPSAPKSPEVQNSGRNALLDSICSFNKNKLNRVKK